MWFCDEMQQNLVLFSSNVAWSGIFVAFHRYFYLFTISIDLGSCNKKFLFDY